MTVGAVNFPDHPRCVLLKKILCYQIRKTHLGPTFNQVELEYNVSKSVRDGNISIPSKLFLT